jgi:hypothetical protein
VVILVALGAYYHIVQNNLFPQHITYIYYGLKALIALEIILGSARSFFAPILGIATAVGIFIIEYFSQLDFNVLSAAELWQLFIVSVVGLLISVLMRL